jgi:WbqC-like protein family
VTTVAIMQPYFFPYTGYFRLFEAADVVVMFDCVQFPRRGWVHRNRFALDSGELDWLTLPIEKAPREARIDTLIFRVDAKDRLKRALERFPLLKLARDNANPIMGKVLDVHGGSLLAPYLCDLVQDVSIYLGILRPIIRSSTLAIAPELRAQDRVISIVQRLGGTRYVNPPGGRPLYNERAFAESGVELRFLTPYEGPNASILTRLLTQHASDIADDVHRQTLLVP